MTYIANRDTQDDIALGRVDGATSWSKFAYRSSLTLAQGESLVMSDNTTTTLDILLSDETFDITYDQTVDGAGTNGATELTFFYLNPAGEFAQATHVLGNTGSDVTSFSGLGINRVAVSASGTDDRNMNDINITASTAGSVQAFIAKDVSVTEQSFFFIPSNSTGIIKSFSASVVQDALLFKPRVTIRGYAFNRNIQTYFRIFNYTIDASRDNNPPPLLEEFVLTAGDVLYYTAQLDNANPSEVALRFRLNVYENS